MKICRTSSCVSLPTYFHNQFMCATVGLKSADDPVVWQYAKENHLIIVSKDSDLHQRSFVLGHPPKLVWVRLGNCSTEEVEGLLRQHFSVIMTFHDDAESSFLALSLATPSKE